MNHAPSPLLLTTQPLMALGAAMLLSLSACTATPRAPIVNRSAYGGVARVDPATLPGHQYAGKPGYYTVQPGDTVRSIARNRGLDWADIARWNSSWIPNPDQIEVGQVLRVVPFGAERDASRLPVAASTVTTARGLAGAPAATPTTATAPAPRPVPDTSSAPPPPPSFALAWPTRGGAIVTPYDGVKNKGIGIGGREGDAVLAAADGTVIYAGSSLRGYGNLVILQHANSYLTVYAHNSRLLVKEKQTVRQGQHIADMGNSDADRVKLHFEVRKGSKTLNPTSLLPAR